MSATPISLPSVTLTSADAAHRQNFKDYCIHQADPSWRATMTRLYQSWEAWNQAYFNGQMTVPYVLLGTPRYPMALGSTQSISDFGGKMQITLRHSVANGTHPHLINGSQDPTGLERFLLDVFLHETVHQYCIEALGKPEEAEKGHGPVFADECTRVGALMGLPPVGPARTSKRTAGVPSCAQWPHNVRPQGYYLGAYDPQAAPTSGSRAKSGSNPNDQALIQLLQAEVNRLNQELSLVTTELRSTRVERDQAKRDVSRYQQSAAIAQQNETNARRERDQALAARDQALADAASLRAVYRTPDDSVRQALVDLLTRYGLDVARDGRRLGSLMKDVAPGCNLENHALAVAVNAGVPADLGARNWQDPKGEFARSRSVNRLVNDYGLARVYAEWSVSTWQAALDAVSSVAVSLTA